MDKKYCKDGWVGCPVRYVSGLLGDKWSILILRDVIFDGKKNYSEFAKNEGIATNILADRLEKLVESDILTRRTDPENKTKKIYSPTQKGLDLIPVMLEIIKWGGTYDAETTVDQEFLEKVIADREYVEGKIRSRHTLVPQV